MFNTITRVLYITSNTLETFYRCYVGFNFCTRRWCSKNTFSLQLKNFSYLAVKSLRFSVASNNNKENDTLIPLNTLSHTCLVSVATEMGWWGKRKILLYACAGCQLPDSKPIEPNVSIKLAVPIANLDGNLQNYGRQYWWSRVRCYNCQIGSS